MIVTGKMNGMLNGILLRSIRRIKVEQDVAPPGTLSLFSAYPRFEDVCYRQKAVQRSVDTPRKPKPLLERKKMK